MGKKEKDSSRRASEPPWRRLTSRYVLDHPWLRVREDMMAQPGTAPPVPFHVLEGPDWVAAVCLDDAGRLVLVEQYRLGVEGASVELPSGVIEPGERPLEAARRELGEETGYQAAEWIALGTFSPDPSRQTVRAHLFFAHETHRAGPPQPDPLETLHVLCAGPTEVARMISDGRFQHGVHVGALALAVVRGLIPAAFLHETEG